MREQLEARVRGARSRALLRSWEYRQRHLAKGVWYRLRRVLAEAREAWAISEAEARRLEAEGYGPEPVGLELEPAKEIFFVPAERLERIEQRHTVALALEAELLESRHLALVAFPAGGAPAGQEPP
jgi:hypothetical protein